MYVYVMEKRKMKIYPVYLAETMYEQARAKAVALGLSFAAYVRMVVAKDLA